jgi:hypothetical protein
VACVPAESRGTGPVTAVAAPYSVLLGADRPTDQWGVIGHADGNPVSLDLSGCQTISLFGVQGFGKSYTLGCMAEMAVMPIPGVNRLPCPLGALVFHYHRSENYAPELLAARVANDDPRERDRLAVAGLRPQPLTDVVLLTPEAAVARRRLELPDVRVEPLQFGPAEIGSEGWRLLLGASGNDALYLRQLVSVLRRRRYDLRVDTIRDDLAALDLNPNARRLIEDRLALATEYIRPDVTLSDLFCAGRTVIVDLRDEWIEKDEALVLFMVLMRIFERANSVDQPFNKLVVFDEAHKYLGDTAMLGEVVETIREARHHGTSVLIASQDPISIPRAVIELSSTLVLHRFSSPLWLKHLKGAVSCLDAVTERQTAQLDTGQALVWSQRSSDRRFTDAPQLVTIRPRVTKHGGATRVPTGAST